jgi:hypothetical protein
MAKKICLPESSRLFGLWFVAFLLSGLPSALWALGGGTLPAGGTVSQNAPATSSAPGSVVSASVEPVPLFSLDPVRYSLMLSGEMLRMGSATQFVPAIALRYSFESPWLTALEFGGAFPTNVSPGFHQDSFSLMFANETDQGHIDSVAEAHLAGVWEFWRTTWLVPELSLGLSIGRFHNEVTSTYSSVVEKEENMRTSVSQLTQLGATVPITPTWSFHADIAISASSTASWESPVNPSTSSSAP